MSQTDKGVLLFYEWGDAMETLPATQFKSLILAMMRYQEKGIEPPQFQGHAASLAKVIFPYLRRRMDSSRAGRMGMYARWGLDEESIKIQEILHKKSQEK